MATNMVYLVCYLGAVLMGVPKSAVIACSRPMWQWQLAMSCCTLARMDAYRDAGRDGKLQHLKSRQSGSVFFAAGRTHRPQALGPTFHVSPTAHYRVRRAMIAKQSATCVIPECVRCEEASGRQE